MQEQMERVRVLLRSVDEATAAGRLDEARTLLGQAQSLASDHPLVLNAAGALELRSGNAAGARRLLERAVQVDGRNASYWVNLAFVHRRLGLPDEESRAIEQALTLEPRNLLALLQKASLYELSGKPRAAAATYNNALATIPRGTRLPESLRGPIDHAFKSVRENASELEALFTERLRELREKFPAAERTRFEHCVDVILGKRRIFTPNPTFLYYPKLPAWEFFPREHFPWLATVEAATAAIRSEVERVLAEDADRLEPYIAYPQGVPLNQWAELNHSRRWSAFYLWRDGRPIDANLARCPETARILQSLPLADVPNRAPAAFFSVLDAKSRIPPHTGVTNTRVIVHLPLVVPPGCGFRVGSETREWRVGEAWVFDDTIEHEAWNESDVPRAILIFDVWNPFLSEAERDLVRTAVRTIGEFNRGETTQDRFE
jgi:aspartate beta-hydroxylase